MMKQIKITQNKIALVDDADFEWLNQWKWHYRNTGYAIRRDYCGEKPRWVRMHRLIINAPKGMEVDHKNGDKLDNRRSNLRIATHKDNCRNVPKRSNGKNIYKGVEKGSLAKSYSSRIKVNGERIYLGSFKTAETAAKAYNQASKKYFGEFGYLNKI